MALNESLQLDGLELNPLPGVASPYSLDEVSFPTPRKRPEWAQGADTDGQALVRDPLFENRTITATVRVTDTTRDLIDQAIARLAGKLEEAEQQPDGLPVVWTPADATQGLTFYCITGEIGDIPITHESGYFAGSVAVPLTLTCRPAGYGQEVNSQTVTGSAPLVTVDLGNVAGDLPAEARVIVTDAASQVRRDVRWGLEQRDYTPGSPTSLLITTFVTTGFAGTVGSPAGAYGASAVTADLYGQPTAVCGTGAQPHIGTFRVIARVQIGSLPVRVRLAWQDGDGPMAANPWVSPPVADNQWCEIDLGLITITPARLGGQRWTGRIEAYTTDNQLHSVMVNYLALIPAGEGYGRARASYGYRPGAVTARDEFAFTGALNGRTATAGGVWATAGAVTDFAGGGSSVTRSVIDATTGRYAVLGSSITDIEVGATVKASAPATNDAYMGVVARYVDANNALRAYINTKQGVFAVSPIVAGASSSWGAKLLSLANVQYRLRLIVFASGAVYATLMDDGGTVVSTITIAAGQIAALAPGGALAAGKGGIFDIGLTGTGNAREYDEFYVASPAAEPIAVYSGRQLEFRHDGVIRQDAAGAYYGRPPAYRGAPVRIPPAGDKNRTSRVVVAARRNDTDQSSDGGVTDATTVQVVHMPRFLVVPH